MYFVKFVVYTGCIKYFKIRRVNTFVDDIDVPFGFYNISLDIDDFGFSIIKLEPTSVTSRLGFLGDYLFTFRGLLTGCFTPDFIVLFGSAFSYRSYFVFTNIVLLRSRSLALYDFDILKVICK